MINISQVIAILTAAFVGSVIIMALHWAPWSVKAREKHINSTVMGAIAILIPFSYLLIMWQSWIILATIWIITCASGATILICKAIDSHIEMTSRVETSERAEKKLKQHLSE